MYYVYLIRSKAKDKLYTGYTKNVDQRISDHNSGKVASTKSGKPWALETYIAFSNKEKALNFEKYLKSGSGKAFANKRFL